MTWAGMRAITWGILLGADGGRDLADVRFDVDEVVEPPDQVGLRPDAVVERLDGHARIGGHVLEARGRVALGREPAPSGFEDVVACPLGLHRPPAGEKGSSEQGTCRGSEISSS